ncbi:MAG: CbrC family protein [Gemmatimonas sp.]
MTSDSTTAESLPTLRYHVDPVASGSVVASNNNRRRCKKVRGFIYTGPAYSDEELDDALCPWCIADGSAFEKFDATFVDSEAFDGDASEESMSTICERTPGFNAWQSEQWPSCCGEPAAFLTPASYDDIQKRFPRLEGTLMMYIVQKMGISGSAATRTLESLKRDQSPTAFVFKCLHCDGMPAYVDAV